MEGAAMDMAEEEAPMLRMNMAQAEVKSDETMTEYALSGNRDILKRSEGTMADLQKYEVPAEYQIAAAAKSDPSAYLTANVKSADLPLMNAFNASIYLKDMFTGNVGIDPDLTRENIEITLGKEERVHPWTAACQTYLSITISQSLAKVMSIALVMPSSHLIL